MSADRVRPRADDNNGNSINPAPPPNSAQARQLASTAAAHAASAKETAELAAVLINFAAAQRPFSRRSARDFETSKMTLAQCVARVCVEKQLTPSTVYHNIAESLRGDWKVFFTAKEFAEARREYHAAKKEKPPQGPVAVTNAIANMNEKWRYVPSLLIAAIAAPHRREFAYFNIEQFEIGDLYPVNNSSPELRREASAFRQLLQWFSGSQHPNSIFDWILVQAAARKSHHLPTYSFAPTDLNVKHRNNGHGPDTNTIIDEIPEIRHICNDVLAAEINKRVLIGDAAVRSRHVVNPSGIAARSRVERAAQQATEASVPCLISGEAGSGMTIASLLLAVKDDVGDCGLYLTATQLFPDGRDIDAGTAADNEDDELRHDIDKAALNCLLDALAVLLAPNKYLVSSLRKCCTSSGLRALFWHEQWQRWRLRQREAPVLTIIIDNMGGYPNAGRALRRLSWQLHDAVNVAWQRHLSLVVVGSGVPIRNHMTAPYWSANSVSLDGTEDDSPWRRMVRLTDLVVAAQIGGADVVQTSKFLYFNPTYDTSPVTAELDGRCSTDTRLRRMLRNPRFAAVLMTRIFKMVCESNFHMCVVNPQKNMMHRFRENLDYAIVSGKVLAMSAHSWHVLHRQEQSCINRSNNSKGTDKDGDDAAAASASTTSLHQVALRALSYAVNAEVEIQPQDFKACVVECGFLVDTKDQRTVTNTTNTFHRSPPRFHVSEATVAMLLDGAFSGGGDASSSLRPRSNTAVSHSGLTHDVFDAVTLFAQMPRPTAASAASHRTDLRNLLLLNSGNSDRRPGGTRISRLRSKLPDASAIFEVTAEWKRLVQSTDNGSNNNNGGIPENLQIVALNAPEAPFTDIIVASRTQLLLIQVKNINIDDNNNAPPFVIENELDKMLGLTATDNDNGRFFFESLLPSCCGGGGGGGGVVPDAFRIDLAILLNDSSATRNRYDAMSGRPRWNDAFIRERDGARHAAQDWLEAKKRDERYAALSMFVHVIDVTKPPCEGHPLYPLPPLYPVSQLIAPSCAAPHKAECVFDYYECIDYKIDG